MRELPRGVIEGLLLYFAAVQARKRPVSKIGTGL
jgi:hypothetical protein